MLSPRTVSRITRGGIAIIACCLFALFFLKPTGWTPIYLIFGAILTACIIAAVREKPPEQPPPPPGPVVSDNFGDASWTPEITHMLPPDADGPWRGVFFGKSSKPAGTGPSGTGVPIWSKPESHTLLVARTRTGKGTRVLLPTLLRYGLGGPDGTAGASMIVVDPKGELASISARARSLTSHVHIMNPWGELGDTYKNLGFSPATYNPLDLIDPRDPNVVSIAQSIGKALSPPEGQKEPFWASSAANLSAAVILWLAQQPGEEKTLRRLADILSNDRNTFTKEFLFKLAVCQGPKTYDGAVKRWSKPFIDMPDVTYGGVMANVAEGVAFLADPQIRIATATSSFSMKDLTGAGKDRPTTLYLVVPPDKIKIQKTWLRLMITAGMHTYKRKPAGARYRCMFMIDELPALGPIAELPSEIATLAGAGVDFTLVIQSFAKLRTTYGDDTDDIIANCAYKWFCNIDDLSTAKYLSETLGRKTVLAKSSGESKTDSFDMKGLNDKPTGKSAGESTNISEMGVDLLPVAKVRQLGPDVAILLSPYPRPEYVRPVDYWRLQDTFAPFRPEFPSLYWPLYYDHNAALAPDKPQCQPQPPPPVQPGAPPIWPSDPTYDPGLYAPQTPPQPAPTESAFAIFRKLFGRRKAQNRPVAMAQPPEPAAPIKPIDFWRYAPEYMKKPSSPFPSTPQTGHGTAPASPPPTKPLDPFPFSDKTVKEWLSKPPAAEPTVPTTSTEGTAGPEPTPPRPIIDLRRYASWNLNKPPDKWTDKPEGGDNET